jgi:hypothetical protein
VQSECSDGSLCGEKQRERWRKRAVSSLGKVQEQRRKTEESTTLRFWLRDTFYKTAASSKTILRVERISTVAVVVIVGGL